MVDLNLQNIDVEKPDFKDFKDCKIYLFVSNESIDLKECFKLQQGIWIK